MTVVRESFDVGVIVGRFQVDDLTDGHRLLLNEVSAMHKTVALVLGLSPCKCTIRNPLDFVSRRFMITEEYPNIQVMYITDVRSDVKWSDNLDAIIAGKFNTESICLYGGRDSFIQYYSGKYKCFELLQDSFTSGSERRKELSRRVNKTTDFRHGVIWAVNNQYPQCLPTVDVAVFNSDRTRILLGRKPDEALYRFVGGFVSPGETFEQAAIREADEELGVRISALMYVGSFVIDDWRYRSEDSKITTILFSTAEWTGTITPGDDISQARWFPFNEHTIDNIVEEHVPAFMTLLGKNKMLN